MVGKRIIAKNQMHALVTLWEAHSRLIFGLLLLILLFHVNVN